MAVDWQITAAREATSPRRLPKNEGLLSTQKRLCFMGVRVHLVVFSCVFPPLVGGQFFNFSMEGS